VIRNVVSAARKVIEEHEQLELTERDSLHVLDLLEVEGLLLFLGEALGLVGVGVGVIAFVIASVVFGGGK
jgi:hypothetical protein